MAKTKLINPGPGALMLVNPTGGKTMRQQTKRAQPTTKRAQPTTRRSRNSYGMRHSRRSNPNFGMVTKGLTLAGGGALTQAVTTMLPTIGGPGPFMDAARTGAVAYLLGMLANRIGMSRFSGDITLGGFAVAGAKIINGVLLPGVSTFFPRPAAPAPSPTNGMGAIGISYQDNLTAPRLQAQRAGLAGIGVYSPGEVPFGAYSDSDPFMG